MRENDREVRRLLPSHVTCHKGLRTPHCHGGYGCWLCWAKYDSLPSRRLREEHGIPQETPPRTVRSAELLALDKKYRNLRKRKPPIVSLDNIKLIRRAARKRHAA